MRARIQLDRMHLRARDLLGDAQRDRPRATAQVDGHGALAGLAGPVDRPAREQLGLGTRNEDAGTHQQLDVAERCRAGQMLQRFAVGPPGHQLVEGHCLLRFDLVDQRQAAAGGPQDVGKQLFGVVGRTGDACVGEPGRGVAQQCPGRAHRAHSLSASSRVAMSASTQEAITASRSPSSTRSRS
jgi:hypothetical protein